MCACNTLFSNAAIHHLYPFTRQCESVRFFIDNMLLINGTLWIGWNGNDDDAKNPYAKRIKRNYSDPNELGRVVQLPGAGVSEWTTCLSAICGRDNSKCLYEIVYEMDFFLTTEYQDRGLRTFSIFVLKILQ